MAKTVFPNRMVAHVWAQQTQEEGRSNNGNLWFQGDTLYSYRTPIARIMTLRYDDDSQPVKVALISSIGYSTTTASKHLSAVHRAVNCDYEFQVPTLAEAGQGRADRLDHAENLAYLVKQYNEWAAKLMHAPGPKAIHGAQPMNYNPARDGWNVKDLADLFAMYARRDPDAIVRFTSSECGGRWPEGKGAMGIFTDHQVSIVDNRLCGGGVTLGVMLLKKE